MKSLVVAATFASLLIAPPGALAKKTYVGSSCGVGSPVENGDGRWIHLTPITRRKGITCAHAKRVAKDALKAVEGLYCDDESTYKTWSIRHIGNENALHARFTRDKVQFDLAEQGSC